MAAQDNSDDLMATDATMSRVEELFAAMDTDGDGACTKHEFLEFLREHKPKDGKWASTSKLLRHFGLNSKVDITVADLREGFRSAKDLDPESFQFRYTQSHEEKPDWEAAIHDAKRPIPWGKDGKLLLLPAASHHFKRPVTISKKDKIPFNETIEWPSNKDHWFEINLKSKEVTNAAGVKIKGHLYTTRMPQGLDRQGPRAIVDNWQQLSALIFLVAKKKRESKPDIPVELKVKAGSWRPAVVTSMTGPPGLGDWVDSTKMVSGTEALKKMNFRFTDTPEDISVGVCANSTNLWENGTMVRTVMFPTDTEKKAFLTKIKKHKMTKVIVLPERKEHYEAGSSELLRFYEEDCGLKAFHTPIIDFTTPTVEHEQKNIEELTISLRRGENVLVHCWGGSGRTGTVITGAIKNFGVPNPIQFVRKVKSVYLETATQEQFIDEMYTVLTKRMLDETPLLAVSVIFGQIKQMCEAVVATKKVGGTVATGSYKIIDNTKYSDSELVFLEHLFGIIDINGDGDITVREFFRFFNKHIIQKLMEGTFEARGAVSQGNIQTGFAALRYNSIEQPHIKGGLSRYTTRPRTSEIAEKVQSIDLRLFLRLLNSEFTLPV